MDVTIRNLELRDLPQVTRLANQTFLEGARFTSRFGVILLDKMAELPDWHFVAVAGDAIVGLLVGIIREEGVGSISWIGTHPDWQGKGIGKKLLDALEEHCRRSGYRKIAIGTPFAREFYAKYDYRDTGAIYRMVRELARNVIGPPVGVGIRRIDLEDLSEMMGVLEDSKHFDFLKAFFQVYEKELDKAFCIEKDGVVTGILVGETDPFNYDLTRALFVDYADLDDLRDLLGAFAYVCSKYGKRWAGFEPDTEELKGAVEAWGWEEAHMPSWYVSYQFEKDLT